MAHQKKDNILDILKFASSIFPALCVLEKNVRYVLSIVRELEGGINPAKVVRQMSRQKLKKNSSRVNLHFAILEVRKRKQP